MIGLEVKICYLNGKLHQVVHSCYPALRSLSPPPLRSKVVAAACVGRPQQIVRMIVIIDLPVSSQQLRGAAGVHRNQQPAIGLQILILLTQLPQKLIGLDLHTGSLHPTQSTYADCIKLVFTSYQHHTAWPSQISVFCDNVTRCEREKKWLYEVQNCHN